MAEPGKPGKPGRPRVPEPGAAVMTWLRPAEYDQVIKIAKTHEVTISALVRSWVRLQIKPK